MRIQSDTEITDFLGVVNDPRFNSMCIRITTEAVTPSHMVMIDGEAKPSTEGMLDAELGRHNQ